ncbi:MAG: hypothetical protein ACKVZ0_13315 [Gemmatimonadales bacterium]
MATRNVAIIVAGVLLFGYFMWPGQWIYHSGGEVQMRTHRISGRSQLFIGSSWTTVDDGGSGEGPAKDTTRMLGLYETFEVEGRGGVDATGYFKGSIYNGTDCTLTRIVYKIRTRRGRDTTVRVFLESEWIRPRTTSDVIFNADNYDAARAFISWGIDSVEGMCPKLPRQQ